MKGFTLVAIIVLFGCSVFAEYGSFTSYVNLEKLYTLEDELIALTDVILKQEMTLHGDKDAHNLCNITSTVKSVKAIHRDIVNNRNLISYLGNPVHVYQLTRRLATDWSVIVKRLVESDVCEKDMREKIENIAENIPTKDQLDTVTDALFRLQVVYNISAADVMSGNILGVQTGTRLSGSEGLELARAAYVNQRYLVAARWLHALLEGQETDETLDRISALNVLSSTYYKLGRPGDAIAALDEILRIDPDNAGAKRNKAYITQSSTGKEDQHLPSSIAKTKQERRLADFCTDSAKPNVTRTSRLFCTYLPQRHAKMFNKPSIKTEVMNFKPMILVFHDMVNTSEQKAIKHIAYEALRESLFSDEYDYPEGLASVNIRDYTRWKWVSTIKEKLRNIALSRDHPSDANLKVRNTGIEGFLPEGKLDGFYRTHVLGNFMIFLSDVKNQGGDVVFPNAKVKVTPEQGSVFFYDTSAIDQLLICPMVYNTEWVAIYSLFDDFHKTISDASRLYNPRAKQHNLWSSVYG